MRKIAFSKEKIEPKVLETFHTIASILILALISALFFYFFWSSAQPRKDFYNELWAPTYQLVHGKSPYNTASLDPVLPAAWFPMAIGFFAPLGWLNEETALLAWFLLCVLELGLIIFVAQGRPRLFHITVITALLACAFPPVLYHFILGQISLTVAVCMLLAGKFATSKHPWLAAFFTALGLSKPHLGALAVFGLSIYYFKQGGVKEMTTFWLKTALMTIILCLPLFFAHPNWIPDAVASMRANPYWDYPSLFVVFRANFGTLGLLPWGTVILAVLAVTYFLWMKLTADMAMYWSLGLALLISPYVGSWDFILLLPIFIATFAKTDWKRKLILVLSYLLAWYGMALVQGMESSYNHFFWWVPLWILLSVAVVTPWKETLKVSLKAF